MNDKSNKNVLFLFPNIPKGGRREIRHIGQLSNVCFTNIPNEIEIIFF